MKRVNKIHWLLVLALALIPVLVVNASGIPPTPSPPVAPAPFATAPLPPEGQQVPALSLEKRGGIAAKMDGVLMELAETAVSTPTSLSPDQFPVLNFHRNRVQVQAATDAAHLEPAIAAFTAAGGEVTAAAFEDTLIQGWLPPAALQTVADEESVFYLRHPIAPTLFEFDDGATTEALSVINAPAWHSSNYQGAGVKVAIIDGGFSGYKSLLGNDLPATVTPRNFVDGEDPNEIDSNSSSPHGTACAEIVHDIAPLAQLYLIKVGTNIDLQEAVNYAINQDVDIISTSLGWYNLTPGDGTGQFANMVQQARNAGILWATAASNDREAHWGGLYNDPEGDLIHNFNGSQNVNYFGPGDGTAYLIPAGYGIRVFLRWDDWTQVNQDYDLVLLRQEPGAGGWSVIAVSDNFQNGGPGQTPTEFAFGATSGVDAFYGFAIERYDSNRNVNFEAFAPKVAPLDELLYARSLANLADAPAAMTVAALDVNSPYPQEPYSSEGPTNGPGGAAGGGFIKPDIAAYANVSTISYGTGSGKFNGTSAATPHVAGAAALVMSGFPGYTVDQVQAVLHNRVIDMGAAGKDTIFGYGRLNLGTPPSPVVYDEFLYLPVATR